MRLFLYFWLFTYVLYCLAAAPSRTIADRGSSPYVSSGKDGFSVNGSSLRFVGTNLYWLPTLETNDDIWNVIRIWAFNDVETAPASGTWFQLVQNGTATINEGLNGLQKLDTIVQMAEQQGLYVIVSLTNNWNPVPNTTTIGAPDVLASVALPRNTLSNDFGGMDLYVRQFGLQNHDDFYTNDNILSAFQAYTNLKVIVLRYFKSPAVFSWELPNDARCNSTMPTSATCTTQTVTKWHALMAAFIASLDPNHIVSSGTSGFQCTDCPKLYPVAPSASPTPSPAPGKKRRKVTLTKEQIIGQRAESRRQNRAAAKRAGTLKEDGIMIRGRWVSTATRVVSSSIDSSTDGSSCVDSQDIPNIPNIGFGSFQVYPDQESYGPYDPNLDPVSNKINSSLAWIQQSAQSAAAVGKPLVLNGFGLVTQTNLNNFVPFNMSYAPYATNTAIDSRVLMFDPTGDVSGSSDFANSAQQEQGYSSFLEMGDSAGLAGIMQYQLDTTNSPSTGDSPNDGYSIAGNTAIQQILKQGAQAMAGGS
ncbi:glycoside hydrolase family 5 protein [Suillus occidentalis]|nr:glycoside hydrolase family 5 protein [Suillus occidentalis]